MFLMKILFFFLFSPPVNLQVQINLYLTDRVSENNDLQYDCLRVAARMEKENDPRQIISYCMGESSSKFDIKENNIDEKFTFSQLAKESITSQQLYLWSAPIDVIERYQFYLNQLPNSEKTSMATEIFYKCTLPNFGPKCEYVLNDYKSDHTSLDETVHDYNDVSYARNNISFQTICDGFPHLLPKFNQGQNETDETNCEYWPVIHIYNRCDGFWNILNGSDEINCDPSPLLNCPTNNHICVSYETNELMCLPIEKANDNNIDCIGAMDEPKLCRTNIDHLQPKTFHCKNDNQTCINAQYICDNTENCADGEDERACKNKDICTGDYELHGSDIAKVLCRYFLNHGHRWRVYFTLDQSQNIIPHKSNNQTIEHSQPRCHRGLDLKVWLDKKNNSTANACLCPSGYSGDICQYQIQRISLTLQFRVTFDSLQTPFIIIISLIDDTNERIIHSYEQFTYLSLKHRLRKFNTYLLFSNNTMKKYAIHIDIYEKRTLNYRGSFIKTVTSSFLPVHRLHFQLDIPRVNYDLQTCSDRQCVHGKCVLYSNDPNKRIFCQCNPGWSGRYCTIPHACTCSPDSLCIGILPNHRSLCVCPLNKMGDRCLIDNNICNSNPKAMCFNGGQCIPLDEYGTLNNKFTCICPIGITGDRCEIAETEVTISFDKDIVLPVSILIHFIEVKINAIPVRSTTFKIMSDGQNSINVYWSLPFHIMFIELSNKNYYLTVLQKVHTHSTKIAKKITSSDRCAHINEVFNQTIIKYSLLRRIKYYHLPCQMNNLSCFYDEIHLCLCQTLNHQRVANCFEFDHNINLQCTDQNSCENGGKCLQEYTTYPRLSICLCPVCFFGSRCQFSTNGFSLSFDTILGYHILPNISFTHQPHAVLISLILTIIITLAGITTGILTFITFKNKITRGTGFGINLLCSSIIIISLMIVFIFKYSVLIISQIGLIENRLFLNAQCISIDFLIRFCLTMDQWLTAFISIERAYAIIKGVDFNYKKTKLITKWAIFGLVLVAIGTNVHDPIYRRLFDGNNDNRIWCVVIYTSAIRILNKAMSIFHFIVPFIIHLISAIIIIRINIRQQASKQIIPYYRKILKEQIQQDKKLLVGQIVVLILGIPRLFMSFASSGCIKSSRNSWLFLVGYFISLIPPIFTFLLFVLPSTAYKQRFHKKN